MEFRLLQLSSSMFSHHALRRTLLAHTTTTTTCVGFHSSTLRPHSAPTHYAGPLSRLIESFLGRTRDLGFAEELEDPTTFLEDQQLVTKGADMTGMGTEGAQFDARQHVSKMDAWLTQNSKKFRTYNEIYESFSEMGLEENLLKGIYAYGLEKPSIVHQRGIVPLCKGMDVIQQSLSGTTVTLSCGVLQRLDYGSTECQALVLVPTRDLAQETEKVIGALGNFLGVKTHACFGGTSVREDQQILSSRFQVIVGTPGRVLDMLRRRALCPDHIRMFVLDEADETLTGGFKDQVIFSSGHWLRGLGTFAETNLEGVYVSWKRQAGGSGEVNFKHS